VIAVLGWLLVTLTVSLPPVPGAGSDMLALQLAAGAAAVVGAGAGVLATGAGVVTTGAAVVRTTAGVVRTAAGVVRAGVGVVAEIAGLDAEADGLTIVGVDAAGDGSGEELVLLLEQAPRTRTTPTSSVSRRTLSPSRFPPDSTAAD